MVTLWFDWQHKYVVGMLVWRQISKRNKVFFVCPEKLMICSLPRQVWFACLHCGPCATLKDASPTTVWFPVLLAAVGFFYG